MSLSADRFTAIVGGHNDDAGSNSSQGSGRGFVWNGTAWAQRGDAFFIVDFSSADCNLINLTALDANSIVGGNHNFVFMGSAAFSAAGQLRFEYDDVSDIGVLYANTDADSDAEFAVKLRSVYSLTQEDLVL